MSAMAKTETERGAATAAASASRAGRRAADREPLILDAASELLDEVGYDHLRVQDVADRAHVGLATIYRRWSTKQELVIAAMRRAKAEVERPETDDPRADLEAFLREMANQMFGPKSCFVVGFITALRTDPELGRVFRESLLDRDARAAAAPDRARARRRRSRPRPARRPRARVPDLPHARSTIGPPTPTSSRAACARSCSPLLRPRNATVASS